MTGTAVLAVAFRAVGTAGVGRYTFLSAIFAVGSIVEQALTTMVLRVAELPELASTERDHQVAAARFVARAGGCVLLLLTAAAAIGCHGVGQPASVAWLTFLLGSATALRLATADSMGLAWVSRRNRALGLAISAGALIRFAITAAFIHRFGLAVLGIAALAAATTERVGVTLSTTDRQPRKPPRSELQLKQVATYCWPLVSLIVSQQLLSTVDAVVVGSVKGSRALGLFRLGAVVPAQSMSIVSGGLSAVSAGLARSPETERVDVARTFAITIAYLVAGLMAGVAILAEPLVRLLLGHDSHQALVVLVLACGVPVLNCVVDTWVRLLFVQARQASIARLVPIEIALNLVGTIALVLLLGSRGAVIATLIVTLALDYVFFPPVARREFDSRLRTGMWSRPTLAALAGILVVSAAACPFLTLSWVVRLLVTPLIAAPLACGVGWLLVGEHGRAILRSTLAKRQPMR